MSDFRLGSCIPVVRMLDEAKARAFYLDFLGFQVDWENRLNNTPDSDLYMQISQGEAVVHLNGHATEATPPVEVRIPVHGIAEYCHYLGSKCSGEKPTVVDVRGEGHKSDMNITDPFGNLIVFWQSTKIAAHEKYRKPDVRNATANSKVSQALPSGEAKIYAIYEKDQRHNNDLFYKSEDQRDQGDLYRERYLHCVCKCGRLDVRAAIREEFDDDLDLRVRKNTDFFDAQGVAVISEKAKQVLEANDVDGFTLHRIPGCEFYAIHLDVLAPVDMTDYIVSSDFSPFQAVTVRDSFGRRCETCQGHNRCFWTADRVALPQDSGLVFGVSFEIQGTTVVHNDLHMTEDVVALRKENGLGGFIVEGPCETQAMRVAGFENELSTKIVPRNPKQLPTPEEVDEFEEFIGFKLDDCYRYFLLNYNGGSVIDGDLECFFPLRPDVDAEEVDSSDLHNWPLRSAHKSFLRDYGDIEVESEHEAAPGQMTPIGTDGHGGYVCLVVDGFARGHLKFFDHETEEFHEVGTFVEFLSRPRL